MKVNIKVGYAKIGLEDFRYWNREYLIGTDVKITDGSGNKIEIDIRKKGTLITVNGKVIKKMEWNLF